METYRSRVGNEPCIGGWRSPAGKGKQAVKRGKELLQARKRGKTWRGGNDGMERRRDKLKRKERTYAGRGERKSQAEKGELLMKHITVDL